MSNNLQPANERFDRTNAVLAVVVFAISTIVYALTVQRSFSFWDCGEFIACARILAIPHPPGFPLFVMIGRIVSLIPFVEDISYRINYISVLSSAATAMFSYLLTVRLVGYFFGADRNLGINRFIAYIGGIAGGLFVAFSRTNWANSVEAEVYGLALALSVAIVWLTTRYFEQRGTLAAAKVTVLVFYLATLGIGIHMTVFLVVPTCAIFFVLKRTADIKDWIYIGGFLIAELILILLFASFNMQRPQVPFALVSILLAVVVLYKVYRHINWALLIAIASIATVMESFSMYFYAAPLATAAIILLAVLAKKFGWQLHWKTALAVVVIGFVGLSVHLFIPIRSSRNPRIDENNPSRDWGTFVDFLDRKQYGQTGMVERMFNRRGTLENQFGRHPHMGFWSYFEEQYSKPGWLFIIPFFALGILGMVVAIRKRVEIGIPFMTLFLLCSAGLVLYMNFADGTQYNFATNDAYLEVRDRDYFFTPAFVFFGIAMGMGISVVMRFIKDKISLTNPGLAKTAVTASSVLVLLPAFALAHNYHACDRSANFIPYNYAANILDTCEPNAILFTSGDNDTFPLWCIQETYDYRKDVRVVNLSLLNTDWYVEQMKNRYDVPISLTEDQILWYKFEAGGMVGKKPKKPFYDQARRRQTFLVPAPFQDRTVKVAEMMVDEIVVQSIIQSDSSEDWHFKQPIYFSGQPYAESPLQLRNRAESVGLLYRLRENPHERLIDVERGYDLYMNTYDFAGYEDSRVYRDENATGVFYSVGVNAQRILNELILIGDDDRAIALADRMIAAYPEFWQTYLLLGGILERRGDSTATDSLQQMVYDTLLSFTKSNPENLFYRQDLGLTLSEIGRRKNDNAKIEEGIKLAWDAFSANPNSAYAFRKLYTVLGQAGRIAEIQAAAEKFAEYKINMRDPLLQQLLGMQAPASVGYDDD